MTISPSFIRILASLLLPYSGLTALALFSAPPVLVLLAAIVALSASFGAVFLLVIRPLQQQLAELRVQCDEAEAASVAKSRFVADMSHELRTPLNAVIGYSEMLQEEVEDAAAEEVKAFTPYLKKIRMAGEHLLGLLNNVLDLAKIEAGKMDTIAEPFNVSALLEQIAATAQPLAEKNQNVLRIENPSDIGRMHSDQTKLRQCLINLLGNACKFTQHGSITLSPHTEKDAQGVDWVIFSVSDTGPGISPDDQRQLFQAYKQTKTGLTSKQVGTGLGLTITRHFVDMLGGHIRVESALGQGTSFIVRLPRQMREMPTKAPHAPAPTKASKQADSSPASQKMNDTGANLVLVIDDDPDIHELIDKYLKKAGYQVEHAVNGEEGLRLARQLTPSLITLDVKMPGIDGWMVLSVLQNDTELRDIPVIMLSHLEDRRTARDLGATDYLMKPLSQDRLLKVVRNYLQPSSPSPAELILNPQMPGKTAEGKPPLVLVVDDNATMQDMMQHILHRAGWEVISASNGALALEELEKQCPDLILLDLMMPEMDGFERWKNWSGCKTKYKPLCKKAPRRIANYWRNCKKYSA